MGAGAGVSDAHLHQQRWPPSSSMRRRSRTCHNITCRCPGGAGGTVHLWSRSGRRSGPRRVGDGGELGFAVHVGGTCQQGSEAPRSPRRAGRVQGTGVSPPKISCLFALLRVMSYVSGESNTSWSYVVESRQRPCGGDDLLGGQGFPPGAPARSRGMRRRLPPSPSPGREAVPRVQVSMATTTGPADPRPALPNSHAAANPSTLFGARG